jgi:hypothetical protein
VISPTAIDRAAVTRQSRNKAGHTVNDQTKVLFTGSETVFSAFAVFYIGDGAVPSNHAGAIVFPNRIGGMRSRVGADVLFLSADFSAKWRGFVKSRGTTLLSRSLVTTGTTFRF